MSVLVLARSAARRCRRRHLIASGTFSRRRRLRSLSDRL